MMMKLIAVTSEEFSNGEPDAINMLFENGLDILHFRKPYASYDETERFIEKIDAAFHRRVVLHDNYELATEFGLKGIHLNRRSIAMDLVDARRVQLSTSRSCHSFEEVVSSQNFDYVFLSPIFDSISKAGYNRGFTPEQLGDAWRKGIINEKVVALGGITSDNIATARQYGFGGVAVLGALWDDFANDNNTDDLLRRFNELKTKCREE